MTKRNTNKARSPYQKYAKREYKYSPAYYAWRRSVVGTAHRLEGGQNAKA